MGVTPFQFRVGKIKRKSRQTIPLINTERMQKQRGPSWRALFFLLLRRLASGLNCNQFARDSHRKSGVLRFLALLSPVDSCNPPELKELTRCLYARETRSASEKKRKAMLAVSSAFSAD